MSAQQQHFNKPGSDYGYDLHTHSTCSDGTDSPAAVVAKAKASGLLGISLTDHDTALGWEEARTAASEHKLQFLPGMEITTKNDGRSTHLLAYGFDEDDAALNDELNKVRDSRINRAYEMVQLLNADFHLPWESVYSGDTGQTIGRPHIADALVAAGYFADRGEAFVQVLGPQSPYYIHTYAIDTAHAIEMVRDAGGQSVLAHPAAARNSQAITSGSLKRLVSAGLWGIELRHPENLADRVPGLLKFATQLDLRVTGSSDYHGSGKENTIGQCQTGEHIWNELCAAVKVPQ